MAKYDLKLKSTDAGTQKARTLTLTNVNPEASANTLKQFTQQLNQLTTNTYTSTDYIVTTNLDTETPPIDTRQTPTITIGTDMPTLANVRAGGKSGTVNYTGDGTLYMRRKSGCTGVGLFVKSNTSSFENVAMADYSGQAVTGGVVIIGLTGTENYKPLEVEYTLE